MTRMLGTALRAFFGFPTISQSPYEGSMIFIIPILEVRKQTWRKSHVPKVTQVGSNTLRFQFRLPHFRAHTLNQWSLTATTATI